MAGTIYSAELPESGQRRVEGFNPATDKLDLGSNSVHGYIVVDTAEGVAFMDPWSGKQTLIVGVSLGQLTVNSFVPVENDHLRQDLSGALAWEHGITQAPNTVYARSHEVGQIDRVAFDADTDVVDFRYYGTREQIYMVDGAEGVVIGNYTTGQTLILLGTSVADLSADNFLFHAAQVREDRIFLQLGLDSVPESQVISRADIPTVGTNMWPTTAGPGTPPSGVAGTTYLIDWDYGAKTVLDFDPATDKLDFKYFRPAEFTVAEVNGSTVITIVGQNQTYTLTGVSLAELDYNNIVAVEDATYQKWRGLIEAADAGGSLPTLRVADAQLTEGQSGTSVMSFTVTLSQAAAGVVSVDYSTLNGTALAGSDYQAAIGRLTFQPGETTKTVQVTINGDATFELNEAFDLVLSSPSGATLADERATGTIVNDDAQAPNVLPAISIADLSVTEGDGAHVHFMFLVTLDKASTNPVTVQYRTANGTALAGSDYEATSGTVTFAPGETAKQIHVDVVGDKVVEADERFTVQLSTPSGATIADGEATGTLLNDDAATPAPSGNSLAFAVKDNWGAGFTGAMTLKPVAALNGWTVEFDASFDISNIWNAEIVSHVGDRYVIRNASWNGKVAANGEVSFGFQASPGGTAIVADDFVINGTPAGGGTDPVPVLPTLAIGDASVAEGNDGTSYLSFTVTLSKAATGAVSVAYASANGTATAGQDYQAVSGTLTFAAGETSKVIRVPVIGDKVVEANEALTITLSTPSGATLADGTATGTITNDDVAATLPTLAIGDASVAEGNDGTAYLSFTVTLSKAATSAVSVAYASANGTATAGQDYQAVSGTLTFAPGETSKVIRVPVIGDKVVEANEALTITLSKPSGATLADASGTGTITNDDVMPPPTVSVAGTTVVEGDAGTGGGAADGWFSTSGNQIIDSAGNSVKIAGVNWFGFESTNASPHGVWTRSYTDMMDQMKDLGFNTIRLPFASATLHATSASGIDYNQNPDLKGLTPLQIMDKIVAYAEEIGMKVILDHHRSSFGAGTSENGLWYDSAYTEAAWIDDWQMLAERYADNTAVIGADLHNEPYNGTWGGGGARDWAAAAERAGNAIGEVNPNWLIFVEGIAAYEGDNYWWGGNLQGVRDRPIELDVPNKLVYSAHDYGNSVYEQPWFNDPNFAEQLPEKFDEMWGYIYRENIAPVLIGEFGTKLTDPKDAPWLEALTSYMAGDFDNDGTIDIPAGQEGISWTYWSWNPNSTDTGGILADDWRTVNTNKLAYLEPIQFDLEEDGGSGAGAYAVFTVTLSAAATQTVTVNYQTLAGDAGASDFTAASGTLSFAPGETTKTVRVAITGDNLAEADESFTLLLSNAQGAVIGVAQASATITDDDAAAPTLPMLSISDATALEGSASAAGMLTFTITLSEAATGPVSVKYATANGSAVAGQDYQAASGTLTFAAGETSKTIKVAAIGDGVLEGNETFNLVLSGPTGATLADGTGRGTIENDDAAPPAGGDAVAFTVASNWGTGFTAAMTLKPEAALNGWTVEFDAPFDISNIWNAQIVSHVGDHYVVRNAAWNGKVAADGEVSFGFQASGGSATVDDFIVNGRAVGGEETSALRTASVPLSNDLIDASIALVESRTADFTAEVTLHNDGTALNGWTLEIDTPYEIAQIQGAEIISRDADGYVVRNLAATAALDHGADVRFQLVGHGTFDSTQFDFLV
ncbi:Calx-beta domain-containing protein [Ancylobacter radicis]|uniref:cellulase n=1 Tax=Ancylobacter radicis TaxID=2836179 RepID=A0ABS5R7S5_9HYPH|nr:Calx-beta domain-containing protein [Ancylobacter radicis]MBS9477709.1 cellulase family glycosylhydrolase [Ancylobacter radicis]